MRPGFLSLVSDDRIAKTLALMDRPRDARLTQQFAHDVGQRVGSKATIEGPISGCGPFTLRLSSVDCRSGSVLAQVEEEADAGASDPCMAGELQRVLDHAGLAINQLFGLLADLGLGRACAIAGDFDQARTAYQDFFALWKDADLTFPS